jgi:hypothetical protein
MRSANAGYPAMFIDDSEYSFLDTPIQFILKTMAIIALLVYPAGTKTIDAIGMRRSN